MTLEETAIATEYVQAWKQLLGDACLRAGLDPSSLCTESVALLDDGSLKVWIDGAEERIAEMTVPRDRWIYCGCVMPS